MRLIDADAAIDALMERFKRVPENAIIAKVVIKNLPSVQSERKTGHWVKSDMQRWYDVWMCSECGEKTDSSVMSEPRYKYCPMCGADMRGDKHVN